MIKKISILFIFVVLIVVSFFVAEYLYNVYTYVDVFKNHVGPYTVLGIHNEPIEKLDHDYFATMDSITLLDDNSIDIKFSQPNFQFSNDYSPIPSFTPHHENIKTNQTFVVTCIDFTKDGYTEEFPDLEITEFPSITVLKYLGIDFKNKIPTYKFLHVEASLQKHMPCNYPEVIKHSIDAISVEITEEFEEN